MTQLGNAASAGFAVLQGVSNFAAGFGDGFTVGITNSIRQAGGYNYAVDRNSFSYALGSGAGAASWFAFGGVGSLSAGSRTVLYSGEGALAAANASKGAGKILTDTIGGKALNVIDSQFIRMPQSVWDAASGIFSANAKGTVEIYLRNAKVTSVYNRIEKPVLDLFNNTKTLFK